MGGDSRLTCGRRARALAAAALAAIALAPADVRAEPEVGDQGEPWRTLEYEPPAPPPTRLRLAIEEGAILGAAITGYTLRKAPPSPAPGAPPWDKLRFAPGTWYFDTDAFPTNNIAHPVAGAFYYTFARANRVSVAEASLWTLAAATAWEIIEYHEPASVNDVWTTSASGMALGEAFTQLSGHFDRRRRLRRRERERPRHERHVRRREGDRLPLRHPDRARRLVRARSAPRGGRPRRVGTSSSASPPASSSPSTSGASPAPATTTACPSRASRAWTWSVACSRARSS